MHYIGLKQSTHHSYVDYVHDLPSNENQQTHMWEQHTNYWNLNLKEIQASVERAQEINYYARCNVTRCNVA